jgi:hypothetical protein
MTSCLPSSRPRLSNAYGPLTGLKKSAANSRLSFIENPDAGDVVRNSGGVRKVRWTRTGSGKSGGVRVIYFIRREHEPTNGQIWLLFMYAKSNLESIAGNKLKELKDAVEKTFIR